MKNLSQRNKSNVLIPVLAGAAVAAALAYFLISEDAAELREELEEGFGKIWGSLKDKAGERLADLKSGVKPLTDEVKPK